MAWDMCSFSVIGCCASFCCRVMVGLYPRRRETLFFLNTKYVRHDIKKIDLHVSTGSILCVAGKQ
jgi:hypothetical protein